jgi:MoaA/NifB/PqqE/SkfB family radical SAM enzyme
MPELFPDFQELVAKNRVKFISIDKKIFAYNVRDSFLVEVPDSMKIDEKVVEATTTPVKTLILHTTYQCNLKCKHCYINAGEKRADEMDAEELKRIVREFGQMGGLGVDLSGGEAMLKEGIEEVILEARNQRLRTEVLTNATDINSSLLKKISPFIDGMAVGLDGISDSNDVIRGQGTFDKAVAGLEQIAEQKIDLSFTTLLSPATIMQLTQFPEFMARYGARSWSLVMPRASGRFADEHALVTETENFWQEAVNQGILKELQKLTRPLGISVVLDHILVPGAKRKVEEKSTDIVYGMYNRGRACWDNTLTIMPNGDVKCCLFFDGQVYDNIREKSLREVYLSQRRRKALQEFLRYPVDKCPFVEGLQLKRFEELIA